MDASQGLGRTVTTILASVGVLAFCCCGGGGGSSSGEVSTDVSTDDRSDASGDDVGKVRVPEYGDADHFATEIDAKVYAQDAVKQNLKYPLDASFGWGSRAVRNDAGMWVVTGTVTAKNAFGAALTHEYLVSLELELSDESKTWRTMLVQIGDEVVFVSDRVAAMAAEQQAKAAEARERAAQDAREAAAWRNFTDNTGEHTEKAKFVKFAGGKAHLEKEDGSISQLPMSRLSPEDQQWIRDELKRRRD